VQTILRYLTGHSGAENFALTGQAFWFYDVPFDERALKYVAAVVCSMVAVPDEFHDLFEKPTIAHLSTLSEDGSPHVAPVWVDYDPKTEHLQINTERHRQKVKNIERDPSVGVSLTDPDDPYRHISVKGSVENIHTDGATEHIDELSQRYTGEDYQEPIESERVLLEIGVDEVVQ